MITALLLFTLTLAVIAWLSEREWRKHYEKLVEYIINAKP
jgi:hypothetical protein